MDINATTTLLSKIKCDIDKAMKRSEISLSVFVDFFKTFDTNEL